MRNWILCCVVLLAAGCTTDIGPVARKAGINTIKVEPRIDVDQPMRIGIKNDTGNLSADLAGYIVNEMYSGRLLLISSNMQANKISVPDMVREGATTMLREQKGFTVVTNGGDGVLVVAIKQYGLDGAGLSLTRSVPFIVLRAELTRRGERIWRGEGERRPIYSGELGVPWEEYQAEPELLREHWQIQIEHALRQLLKADSGE